MEPDFEPLARPIEVVSAAKFARSLISDNTLYLCFIEVMVE